ncbi:hypothetical protein C9374_006567 [Naegleria lovaniensis]|uniref:non-specific serine/threonine protein kinase n=1 Tax=Naegleria lovaniensis TaxID=51637 RepID=A0AA88KHD0_NAELO|nr:uncharacterized protein C9374_006567 [Naegleria lovaniensis]KAG2379450.1 hypothetical protein C9374_006567 [Naegleria lovaniensis]
METEYPRLRDWTVSDLTRFLTACEVPSVVIEIMKNRDGLKLENISSPLELAQECGIDLVQAKLIWEKLQTFREDKGYPKDSESQILTEHSTLVTSDHQLSTFMNTKYDSMSYIGAGGFSTVYYVVDKKTMVKKALKIIPVPDIDTLNSVLQESMRLRLISHPNIVKIYSVFAPGVISHVCLELELLKGSLYSLFIERNVKLPEKMLRDMTCQICSAFLYLKQDMNTVHGDVNPTNILVREFDLKTETIQVALSDFGLEKVLTNNCYAMGTQLYIAPELLESESNCASIASDMFALGAQLVQLMTLDSITSLTKLCLNGTNMKEYLSMKLEGSGYSSVFIDLVTSMVQLNPEDRISPQDAIQVLHNSTKKIELDSRLAYISFPGPFVTGSNDRLMLSHSGVVANTNMSGFEEFLTTQYSHIEYISKGGFGVVYKAFNPKKSKYVAVKVIMIQDNSSFNLAFQEALNMTKLTHPNIVPMYDAFTPGTTAAICIEMELMKGSLHSLFIEKKIKLPERMLREIIKQVCDVLNWLHTSERKLLHRDIKPGNILVKDYSLEHESIQVALCDFGLAKSINDLTNNTVPGTKSFLATELLDSKYAENGMLFSPASDIFALGVTLYQLMALDITTLIGVKSMVENDMCQFLKLILLKQDQHSYSTNFIKIVASMLRPRPSERITSQEAIEMLSQDVQQIVEQLSPVSPESSFEGNFDTESVNSNDSNSYDEIEPVKGEPLQIEEFLKKKYLTTEFISSGFFGSYFRVVDVKTGKEKALKIINANYKTFNVALKESTNMLKLAHPHILKVYDVFTPGTQSSICIEMEFTHGDLLSTIINSSIQMPEKMVRQVILQICGALEWMEQHDIIHRSIQPNKIRIRSCDMNNQIIQVALGGFGVSSSLDELSEAFIRPSINEFTAPEVVYGHGLCVGPTTFLFENNLIQKAGHTYSPSSDMFAFGVTLYQLLTFDRSTFLSEICSKESFQTSDMAQFLKSKLTCTLYSMELIEIISSMLHVQPSQRITAKQVCQLLQNHTGIEKSGMLQDCLIC